MQAADDLPVVRKVKRDKKKKAKKAKKAKKHKKDTHRQEEGEERGVAQAADVVAPDAGVVKAQKKSKKEPQAKPKKKSKKKSKKVCKDQKKDTKDKKKKVKKKKKKQKKKASTSSKRRERSESSEDVEERTMVDQRIKKKARKDDVHGKVQRGNGPSEQGQARTGGQQERGTKPWNDWASTQSLQGGRKQKFLRLMGAMKGGQTGGGADGGGGEKRARDAGVNVDVATGSHVVHEMEHQWSTAMGSSRGMGLGWKR